MFDEKLLRMVVDAGVFLASTILIFRPIVMFMISRWSKEMDANANAHEYQRKEHGEQADMLREANNKLDVLVGQKR